MIVYCQLKGSTFCGGQNFLQHFLSSGQSFQDSKLFFIREPNCMQDKNCVQVWYERDENNVRLGNVNRENAPLIATCMDSGGTVKAISHKFYGDIAKGEHIGLYFMVNTEQRQA